MTAPGVAAGANAIARTGHAVQLKKRPWRPRGNRCHVGRQGQTRSFPVLEQKSLIVLLKADLAGHGPASRTGLEEEIVSRGNLQPSSKILIGG